MTALAVAAVAGAVLFLAAGSVPALQTEGLRFLTTARWSYRHEAFGAAAMIYGSAAVSLIALAIAIPVGIGTAIFTAEICRPRARVALKIAVELLAGVPSVVYGLLGVLFLRQWMAGLYERLSIDALSGDTLFTAGVLLAIMVLPTIATLADDALQSVRRSLRDGARGLGLTRAETILTVVIPAALPGLVSAVLLGLGRALGETIAVFLVVGRADNRLPESVFSLAALFDAGQTLTSKLGGAEINIAAGGSLHMSALLALALVLVVAATVITLAGGFVRGRVAPERAR